MMMIGKNPAQVWTPSTARVKAKAKEERAREKAKAKIDNKANKDKPQVAPELLKKRQDNVTIVWDGDT